MQPNNSADPPLARLARTIGQRPRFPNDSATLDKGERAALCRLAPEAMRAHQVAALARALVKAEIDPTAWSAAAWQCWALVAHGIALAGHDASRSLGVQLCEAGVSESRVTKMLTARGDAFRQLIPQLLRLLASRSIAPNWNELGPLILGDEQNDENLEQRRLTIAGRYFSALNKKAAA